MESLRNCISYFDVEDGEFVDFNPTPSVPKHIDHGKKVYRNVCD